jgi:succinyl-CoA synthetase beta subunit
VYLDLDFSLLEMNPFTLDAAGKPFPLDMRGELDDTATYRRWIQGAVWLAVLAVAGVCWAGLQYTVHDAY